VPRRNTAGPHKSERGILREKAASGIVGTMSTLGNPAEASGSSKVLHSGAAPTRRPSVPTRHRRISVTNDPALDEAIARARPLLNGAPDATIVRALAIRGAQALVEDEGRRRDGLERLGRWATDPASSMDRETLLQVRDLAWHRE